MKCILILNKSSILLIRFFPLGEEKPSDFIRLLILVLGQSALWLLVGKVAIKLTSRNKTVKNGWSF